MTVYESDLPGVGRKFELDVGGDERVVVVVHHDGRREVFRRPSPDADSEKLFDLDDQGARQLAAMLQGMGFETVDVTNLAVPLGDAIIEWTEVPGDSALVGQTLGGADVREKTGVSIIAVQRGEETIPNPPPDFEIEAGDVLVGLGTRREHAALAELR